MDIIEINTDCSSNGSSTTVLDEIRNYNDDVNIKGGSNIVSKNIYDLSEFEESSDVGGIRSYTNRDNCSEILKNLSQKYLASTSSSNFSHSSNVNEVITLSDFSSDEDSPQDKTILNENDIFDNQRFEFNNDKLQTKSYSKTETALRKSIDVENDEKESDNVSRKITSSHNGNDADKGTNKKCSKKKQKAPKSPKDNKKQTKKSNKPENLLEDIIVNIDSSIYNNVEYGDSIKQHLESCAVTYRMISSLNGVISWSRKMYTTESSVPQDAEEEEKHYLLVLMPHQLGSLMPLILNIKEHTNFHHLTVLVYGLSKPTPAHEEEMFEIDMHFSIFWQYVLTKEDLASFIFMVTKSVSQIPYKKEQEEKYKLQNEYFNDSNKDVVKIDKKGNGLNRLWCQMLTKFPLASLETAEAVVSQYPTMSSLFQAYQECDGYGEALIQDLPIRRAQGPLAAVKKLGPELSRKCYKYFTSEENIFL